MKSYKKYIVELFYVAKKMGLIRHVVVENRSKGKYIIRGLRNRNRTYLLYKLHNKFSLHHDSLYSGVVLGEVNFRTNSDLYRGRLKGTRSRISIQVGIARLMARMFEGRWNRLRFLWRAVRLM